MCVRCGLLLQASSKALCPGYSIEERCSFSLKKKAVDDSSYTMGRMRNKCLEFLCSSIVSMNWPELEHGVNAESNSTIIFTDRDVIGICKGAVRKPIIFGLFFTCLICQYTIQILIKTHFPSRHAHWILPHPLNPNQYSTSFLLFFFNWTKKPQLWLVQLSEASAPHI